MLMREPLIYIRQAALCRLVEQSTVKNKINKMKDSSISVPQYLWNLWRLRSTELRRVEFHIAP